MAGFEVIIEGLNKANNLIAITFLAILFGVGCGFRSSELAQRGVGVGVVHS